MIVSGASLDEIRFICHHLRPLSRSEMFLLRADEDEDALAAAIDRLPGLKWVAYHDGVPAACIGLYPMHPGCIGLFGFGTDAYRDVMIEVTKHGRREVAPLIRQHARRAECMSPVDHHETHKWLRFLGLEQEAVLRRYGKGGEDMAVFAWTKED